MNFSFFQPYQADKVRVGSLVDGGYVLEKSSLEQVDIVYSYGVGWDVSFELDLFKRIRKPIRLFDPTLFDKDMRKLYQQKGRLPHYIVKVFVWRLYFLWLRLTGRKLLFYNEGLAAGTTGKYHSFSSHLRRFGDENKRILLKIDVEGSEYDVLKDKLFQEDLQNVVQIAIELHGLDTYGSMLREIVESMSDRFSVVHVHANNYGGTFTMGSASMPQVIEVTFINNKYLKEKILDTRTYPLHHLDHPNNPALEDIPLTDFLR